MNLDSSLEKLGCGTWPSMESTLTGVGCGAEKRPFPEMRDTWACLNANGRRVGEMARWKMLGAASVMTPNYPCFWYSHFYIISHIVPELVCMTRSI